MPNTYPGYRRPHGHGHSVAMTEDEIRRGLDALGAARGDPD